MEHLIALIATTLLLVMIPGPNVALIVANSMQRGMRFGLVTVAGTTCGVALQLTVVVLGLANVLAVVAEGLFWLKWLGVAYLFYLSISTWRKPAENLMQHCSNQTPLPKLFTNGVLLALINPKTLLFNAAFLPQFVAPAGDHTKQLTIVAVVFLLVLAMGDAIWALFASFLRSYLLRFSHLRNKLSATFYMVAGVGLAAAREQ